MADHDTPISNASLQRRMAHSMFQYGALGTIVASVIVAGFLVLRTFIPIWVERFRTDEIIKVEQIVTLKQMSSAMESLRTDLKNDKEAIAGAISVACAKRR